MIDAKAVALEIAEDAFRDIDYLTVCERLPGYLSEMEQWIIADQVMGYLDNADVRISFQEDE